MASITKHVTVLEVSQISPLFNLPESPTEFSLPLTFFDISWLKFPPIECITFYKLTELTSSRFNLMILPQVKHSLSHALLHFLPLAGNIIWKPNEPSPIILFAPNDGVSLTVAESTLDFDILSGNKACEASLSCSCVPELLVEDTKAATIALQITLFPNRGFCIGASFHHAIVDGKSVTLFIKAWAHMCSTQTQGDLPPELTPFLHRSAVQDPEGLAIKFLNWLGDSTLARSLKLQSVISTGDLQLLRATFVLSREDIKKLREMVMSKFNYNKLHEQQTNNRIHLSRFVLAYAYTVVCIVKAKKLEKSTKVSILFITDCRARLDHPVPENYFGNCLNSHGIVAEAKVLVDKNGVAYVVKKLSELIKEIEKGSVLEGIKETAARLMGRGGMGSSTGLTIGVASLTQFGGYENDFGWGKPAKMEVTSIDRTGVVFMAEGSDGNGGVEISVVLNKEEMHAFQSLFADGIMDFYVSRL